MKEVKENLDGTITNNFHQSIYNEIKNSLQDLQHEWNKIKLSKEEQNHRIEVVRQAIQDSCENILTQEKEIIKRLQEKIIANKSEMLKISKALNFTIDEDYENLPILKLEEFLSNKLKKFQSLKAERQEEIQQLMEEDEQLCKLLGENKYCLKEKEIPLKTDLESLQNHIKTLQDEKVLRQQQYKHLRKDIIEFTSQLEKSFEDTFLLEIICSTEQDALAGPPLTRTFLQDVGKLHSDLEFEIKELESRSLELREQIFSLWSLLNIPTDVKDAFLELVPQHSIFCIAKLNEELDRLKELRKQNLSRLIKELRTELWHWWGKCYVGEEEKETFNKIDTAVANEATLEAYECEVNRWQNYYSAHTAILNQVDHFLTVFDHMRQLDEKSKDPTRLFKTRGGALLQEEKERKSVKAQLPVIQTKLEELGIQFEKDNKYPFRIDGKPVDEYLEHIWNYHTVQRELEKNKMHNRKLGDLPPKRSAMKTPTTPAMQRKRLRDTDDTGGRSASKRVATTSYFKSPAPTMKPPSSSTKIRPLAPRNQPSEPSCDDTFVQMSYDKFKERLQTEFNCLNSTTFSDVCGNDKMEES